MEKILDPSTMLSIAFCASLGWGLGGIFAGLIRMLINLIFTFVSIYTKGE